MGYNIFFDRSFIYNITPNILGFFYQTSLAITQLFVLWCINDTTYTFLDMLQQKIIYLALFSMLPSAFVCILLYMLSLPMIKYRIFSSPIRLISSFDEISLDRETEADAKYEYPLANIGLGVFAFMVFFGETKNWEFALLVGANVVLLGSFIALGGHLTMMVLEIIILLLRYFVQHWLS